MKKSIIIFVLAILVNFAAFAQTFTQTYTPATGAIPDAGATTTCFPIVTTGIPVTSGVVSVTLNITHTFDADLDIFLKGPDGTLFELSTDNGAAGANYTNTLFVMNAPTFIYQGTAPFNIAAGYRPEGCGGFNLLNANNVDKNGSWELCIRDDLAGNVGNLNSWSINFNTVNNNPMPSDEACGSPLICSFDSYSGITYPAAPPAGVAACYTPGGDGAGLLFCSGIQNNSWLQFIASASTVVLNVNVGNCTSGVQFAIYSTTNCAIPGSFTYATGSSTTSCYGDGLIGSNNLTFTGLTAGTTYYMTIDGFGGDVCNYTINPVSGVSGTLVTPSVPANQSICAGETVTLTASSTGATSYTWTSIPAGFSASTATVTVTPSVTTTYFVTAMVGSGACTGPQTASTTVTVYTPNIVASGNLVNCDSDDVTLTLTNPPATAGGYTTENITYAAQPHTGTDVAGLGDDNNSGFLPIGFNFTFYGNTYNQFIVGSNGYIGFTNTNMGSRFTQTLPNTATPNNIITLAWDDLDVQNVASRVKYETTGTAPNRVLKVSFQGVPLFVSTPTVTGQILLYETTNYIDVICIDIQDITSSKTMGVENSTGTLATAAPGRNNVGWTCSNNTTRFKPPVPNITWSTGATGVTSITTSVGGAFSLTANTCASNVVNIAVTPSRPTLPTLPNITGCGPTTVNGRVLNPQGGDIYSWTGPGGFTANTASITVSVAGTYTMTVSRPSGSGAIPACVRTTSFTFSIPAPPTVTVGSLFYTCSPFTIDADPSNVNAASTVYTWTDIVNGTTLSFTGDVATLSPGTYTVKASNGPLCERTSGSIVVSCPQNAITATYSDVTSLITVSWTDVFTGELGYELQRTDNLAAGTWTTVNYTFGGATFPANSTEYIDGLLEKGKTYCYRIRFLLPTFTGSANPNYTVFSNVACASVPKGTDGGDGGLPPYEYHFTGTAGNQSVTLSWSNPDAAYGFDVFDVYFGIAPQDATIRITSTTANSFTVTGLVNGNTYNFKVRARYRGTAAYYDYSNSITLRPSIILGQDELVKPFNFDIAPNPNNGEFELKLSGTPSSKVKMQIFNVAGQVVMTKEVDGFAGSYQETFRLDNISSGLYFLQIDTDNESMQKKISIVR